ncbi:MAG: lactate utilization protein [Bacteroidales bacterium]|nr:MAG: lactate utilization protein [Bacteroidales bacterium]
MIVPEFIKNACKVSSHVSVFENTSKALAYISEFMANGDYKSIAIPDLTDEENKTFTEILSNQSIQLYKSSLRKIASNIQVGITKAQLGIAETGTLVINSNNEDVRLASMLSDIHFALLKTNTIVAKSSDIVNDLREMFKNQNNYTAFITGPSRTADIERVLSIGVHGPLELYILLIEN